MRVIRGLASLLRSEQIQIHGVKSRLIIIINSAGLAMLGLVTKNHKRGTVSRDQWRQVTYTITLNITRYKFRFDKYSSVRHSSRPT
jgi:hypothetical protein